MKGFVVHAGRKQQLLCDGVVRVPWHFTPLAGASEDPAAGRAHHSVCIACTQHRRQQFAHFIGSGTDALIQKLLGAVINLALGRGAQFLEGCDCFGLLRIQARLGAVIGRRFPAVRRTEAGALVLNPETHDGCKGGTGIFDSVACLASAPASNKWVPCVDIQHEASAFNVRIGAGATAFVVGGEPGGGFGWESSNHGR